MDIDTKSGIRSVSFLFPFITSRIRMTRGNRTARVSVTNRDTNVTLSPSVWFKLVNCTLVAKLLVKFYFGPQTFMFDIWRQNFKIFCFSPYIRERIIACNWTTNPCASFFLIFIIK